MATVVGDMQAPINDAVEMAFLGLHRFTFLFGFSRLRVGRLVFRGWGAGVSILGSRV